MSGLLLSISTHIYITVDHLKLNLKRLNGISGIIGHISKMPY